MEELSITEEAKILLAGIRGRRKYGSGEYMWADNLCITELLAFAEYYHAEKCKSCSKVEPRKYCPFGQEPMGDENDI